jgi:hypothetical protein
MKWFLVIYMFGSDEVLVKEMPTKQECVKEQKTFENKAMKKIKSIEAITCEQGDIMNTISREEKKDEIL